MGKPLSAAKEDVTVGIQFIEYYAAVSTGHEGRVPDVDHDSMAYIREEPYGPTGQILPWNYPILLMGWKVGAALAAGNTSVTKPAEQAPLSITCAAQLSQDLLPDGVFNVVNGSGSEAGAAVAAHTGLRKLSFTGSVPVGQEIMRAAANGVRPVTLELGGKIPLLYSRTRILKPLPKQLLPPDYTTMVSPVILGLGSSFTNQLRKSFYINISQQLRTVLLGTNYKMQIRVRSATVII